MTPAQKVYFTAIKKYIEKNNCSPSYEEIGQMVGVSSMASIARIVKRLIAEGVLVRGPGAGRNLIVVPGKLYGFNFCERSHTLIYFMEAMCPLCTEIQKNTPPREVHVG